MRIRIFTLGGLQNRDGQRRFVIAMDDGSRVRDALNKTGIEGLVETSTIILNRKRAELTEILHDGDTLYVFPQIAGG